MVEDKSDIKKELGVVLEILLANFGDDLLAEIQASEDPLGFGYASGKTKFLLSAVIAGEKNAWDVQTTVYRKGPWPHSLQEVGRFNTKLQSVIAEKSSLEETLRVAFSKVDRNVLKSIAKSKEPLTFTVHKKIDEQVEVMPRINGDSIEFDISID